MNYAIKILEKEYELIEKCLSNWDLEKYPEARKERNDKLKDLTKAIEYLKSKQINQ